MCRLALLATFVVCVALAYVARADAAVVVQRSIAGVRIGDTYAQVTARLGRPRRDRKERDEIHGNVRHLDYGLTDIYMNTGADGTVTSVTTTSKRERTARGVGVGSSVRTVAARVKGARCEIFGTADCHVGTGRPGTTVTDFFFDTRNHVARVTIGLVID